MSALRHGSLADQDLSLLKAGSSGLRHQLGGLSTYEHHNRSRVSVVFDAAEWAYDDLSILTYIGERDADGWIHAPEGGWSSNPVPGMVVEVRLRAGLGAVGPDVSGYFGAAWEHAGEMDDIIAFRPASIAHPAPEQVASGREGGSKPTHHEAHQHIENSDDPVVVMLRRAAEALDRDKPDMMGAKMNLHAGRLAVSVRLLEATPSAQADRGGPETGWLIESDVNGPIYHQAGGNVTRDVSQALRFSRQQDAEAFIRAHGPNHYSSILTPSWRAVEHRWG